jgi:hypothetical protein
MRGKKCCLSKESPIIRFAERLLTSGERLVVFAALPYSFI